jgi:predicted transcriptional regulator
MVTEVTLKKSQVINSFQDLPEDVTANDLIERILFIQRVERGLKQIERGEIVDHEQVMRELKDLKNR